MSDAQAPTPKHPSAGKFLRCEQLAALYSCWERVRGDKMLPSKQDFEGEMLNFPEFLSDMTLVEPGPNGEILYRYVGSQIVTRRDTDQTGKLVRGVLESKAEKLVLDWGVANFKMPHIVFFSVRTHLPSGVTAESSNLVVPLSGQEGLPPCLAMATAVDDAYRREIEKGGFLLGSAGIAMNPINIGYGVPDIPRTVE